MIYIHRGDEFRKEFSKLGEIRSLLPDNIRIMALTATASQTTRKVVCRMLGMVDPAYIIKSPDKPNIFFNVFTKPATIAEAFDPLIEHLRQYRTSTDRTIIFCQNYVDSGNIYKYFDN